MNRFSLFLSSLILALPVPSSTRVPVIEAQDKINERQGEKYDLKDAEKIKRQQDARNELKKYTDAIGLLKQGQVQKFIDATEDLNKILGAPAPKQQ